MNGWERENNSSITEEKEDCAQYIECLTNFLLRNWNSKLYEKHIYGESRFSCNFRPNTKDHHIIN